MVVVRDRSDFGGEKFASVERETGVESGWATVAPDRYNKWDNDITGISRSRACLDPNIVIITFGLPSVTDFFTIYHRLREYFPLCRDRKKWTSKSLLLGKMSNVEYLQVDNGDLYLRVDLLKLFFLCA